jgi:uncharacterized protein (TIGR03382 family)
MTLLTPHARLLAALVLAASSAAEAFTLQTPASDGCHERITLQALSRVGWPDGAKAPARREDDEALFNSVYFTGANDLWELALVFGVRDPDVGAAGIGDLDQLAAIHNGVDRQAEHCLRAPEDDGPLGDAHALANCRAHISRELQLAHGEGDTIDLTATVPLRVALKFQTADIQVSRYAFHMGRALHALEDSFSHTFRSEDATSILAVFNYVDPALASEYLPDRDGPPHESHLDHCDGDDGQVRAGPAATASAELLTAFASYDSREVRLAAAGAVLDRWMGYTPGCDEANAWCGHSEPTPGCSTSGSGGPALFLAGLLGWVILRRRSRAFVLIPSVMAVLVASRARADEWESVPRISVRASSALALDRGGAAVAVGASVALSARFRLGAEVEFSPWFDLQSISVAPGTVNACAYGSIVWARPSGWEVQSELRLGGSLLLFDVPGAHAGAMGVFLGVAPIRVVMPLSPRFRLELSPELAVAVPSLGGVPLAYRQYRFTVGFRWDV